MGLVLTSIEQYEVEKKFTKELASKQQLDHLLFLAYNDLIILFPIDLQDFEEGTFYYRNGSVSYSVSKNNESLIWIEMIATVSNQDGKSAAILLYDSIEAKVVQWIE